MPIGRNKRARLLRSLPFVLTCLPTAAAQAQLGFLDKIFGNVSDVNASRLFGKPYGRLGAIADSSLGGLGIEVTLDAVSLVRAADRKCPEPDSSAARDSTLTEIRVRHAIPGGGDSTLVYKITPIPCAEASLVDAELGLGYTQMQGIRGAFGVQGSIEELPFTALYVSFNVMPRLKPYVGVIAGLAQLKNFRASGDSGLISAAASTFEYGPVGGIAYALHDRLAVFLEVAWIVREFDGVAWSASGGKEAFVPPALQEPLRLSTRVIAIGGQFQVGRPKE